MPEQTRISDQVDILTELESARASVATLTASVAAFTSERDTLKAANAKFETDLTAARTNVTTLTGERDAARTEAVTLKTANADLTAKMADFDKALAARLVSLGVNPKAIETPKLDAGAVEKMTVTEISLLVRSGQITEGQAIELLNKRK